MLPILLTLLLFFSQTATATSATVDVQPAKNPEVRFVDGLVTVKAKEVTLASLLEAIGKETGIAVSVSESLKAEKVTIQFEALTVEKGLKAILQVAGIVNNALVYHQSAERGKIGQWVIEEIHLMAKGASKAAPVTATVSKEKPKGKTSLDKEPFFDKKLNRFVEVVKGEVLVRFKQGSNDEAIGTILKALGATILRKNQLGVYRLKIPDTVSVSEFIDQQAENKSLERVEPNFIVATLAAPTTVPNDPSFSSQWAIYTIHAEKAWEITTGSSSVVVAILDTGIDLSHQDLKNKVVRGTDIVNADTDPSDDNGHGTHLAGIVAAQTDNSLGIAGISWGSMLMPVKVITASGEGAYSDVTDGILYAADNGARILNFSIGGYSYSQTLGDAVE